MIMSLSLSALSLLFCMSKIGKFAIAFVCTHNAVACHAVVVKQQQNTKLESQLCVWVYVQRPLNDGETRSFCNCIAIILHVHMDLITFIRG